MLFWASNPAPQIGDDESIFVGRCPSGVDKSAGGAPPSESSRRPASSEVSCKSALCLGLASALACASAWLTASESGIHVCPLGPPEGDECPRRFCQSSPPIGADGVFTRPSRDRTDVVRACGSIPLFGSATKSIPASQLLNYLALCRYVLPAEK